MNLRWEKSISLTRTTSSCVTRTEGINVSKLEVSKFQLQHYSIMEKISTFMVYYVILEVPKFDNQTITRTRAYLSNGLAGVNYQLGYYVSTKNEFAQNLVSVKMKIVQTDMKKGGYPLSNADQGLKSSS